MSQNNNFLHTYLVLKSRFIEFFQKNLVFNLSATLKNSLVRIPLSIDKLWAFDPYLTKKLLKNPINYISIIDQAAYTVYKNLVCFNQNEKIIIKSSIEGPFENRICHLKNLKATFIGEVICIKGLVVKYTEIKIKIEQSVHFSSKTEKFFVNEFKDSKKNNCWYYLFKDENMNSLETEYGLCKFVNWQNILVQDYSGQNHKKKTVDTILAVLENDLVNTCLLGQTVELCGIYSPFLLSKFHFESDFFSPALFVLSVKNLNKIDGKNVNQFDYFLMKNFSILVNSFQKLSSLVAPRIFGQNFVKKGILLFLTSGTFIKNRYLIQQSTNINFLLIGESQKTKSELLSFIAKVIPSSIFLEGNMLSLAATRKNPDFVEKKKKKTRYFLLIKKFFV